MMLTAAMRWKKSVFDYARGTCVESLPTTTRPGYFFGGWYTQKNGQGTRLTTDYILTDSITVYAKWTLDASAFLLSVNYTKANEEDGLTITNLNSLSKTCSVYLDGSTINLSSVQPDYLERTTRDFAGYFAEEGIKICDSNGNLLPNAGKYTDSNGKWIYNLRVEQTSLTIYAKWVENIKATSVALDSTEFNVGIGETFTISGSYSPADANTTLKLTDAYNNIITAFGNIAEITEGLTCENGRFSIRVKAIAHGSTYGYIRCIYNNSGAAFNIKSGYISQIDPDDKITDIDLPFLTSKIISIPLEPANSAGNFTVMIDTTRPYPYRYNSMLEYSIQDSKLTITSLGETDLPFTSRQYYGSIPLKIYDYSTGLSKQITVHIIPSHSTYESLTPTTTPWMDENSFNYFVDITEYPIILVPFYVEAGKGYAVYNNNVNNSTTTFFDESFNPDYSHKGGQSINGYRNRRSYVSQKTGIVYVGVYAYVSQPSETITGLYLQEFKPVTEITLSQTSLTMNPGETVVIDYSIKPDDALKDDISYYYETNNITTWSYDESTITVHSRIPGKNKFSITDFMSSASVECPVVVLSDSTKEIDISPDSAPSYDISDYEIVNFSPGNIFKVYRIQMEAGKTYYFQNVDRWHAGTGNDADKEGKIDCEFRLNRSDWQFITRNINTDYTYTCTTTGLYYYIASSYSDNVTGQAAFHIWAEDTP